MITINVKHTYHESGHTIITQNVGKRKSPKNHNPKTKETADVCLNCQKTKCSGEWACFNKRKKEKERKKEKSNENHD